MKAGIYYSLVAKISQTGTPYEDITLGGTCEWTNKKGAGSSENSVYGTVRKLKYSSRRRLKAYSLDVEFSWYYPDGLDVINIKNKCNEDCVTN